MARIPSINGNHKICIICEGYEDYEYFNRLLELRVWSDSYDFHTINAKSASNIPARFQNAFQNDMYELILVFVIQIKNPIENTHKLKRK